MRTLLLLTLLYSNTLLANSFEVEAIHLKNGDVVSVQDESYSSLDEVRAIEIVDETNTHSLISPRIFKMLVKGGGDAGGGAPMNFSGSGNDPDDIIGGDMGGGSPMRIGGDGSGGSPMMRMSTKAAVRIGGDGSGGG